MNEESVPFTNDDKLFRAAVREGITQAECGEFVEDDDVRLWLEEREA